MLAVDLEYRSTKTYEWGLASQRSGNSDARGSQGCVELEQFLQIEIGAEGKGSSLRPRCRSDACAARRERARD